MGILTKVIKFEICNAINGTELGTIAENHFDPLSQKIGIPPSKAARTFPLNISFHSIPFSIKLFYYKLANLKRDREISHSSTSRVLSFRKTN
jgi:hypothetical protein